MPSSLRRWWWLPPLALLFFVAWGPALSGPFQFDDDRVIVDYSPVHTLAAWWASLPGLRPLLKLSYALNWRVDPGPFGFHLVNLVIHALNGALALVWLRRALPPTATGDALRTAAPWVVVLWLLHPATTEAVTYISGRSVSLAATFTLAALCAAAGESRRAPGWAALFTALALAVRETSWALPAALLLVEWLRGRSLREAWRRAVPSLLVVLLAAAAFLLEPHYRHLLATAFGARDAVAQAWTQVEAYRWFAGQALLLDPPAFDPDLRVQQGPTPALTGAALALAALLAFALWRVARDRSWAGGGVLLCFLFLLPGNGFVPRLDVANDRHLYLPLLGLLLAFAAVLCVRTGRAAQAVLAALAVILFAAATGLRNLDYRSEVALWQRTVEQSPGKSRAWNNLGIACRDAGDTGCAADAFRHAIALDPDNTRARANLYFLAR